MLNIPLFTRSISSNEGTKEKKIVCISSFLDIKLREYLALIEGKMSSSTSQYSDNELIERSAEEEIRTPDPLTENRLSRPAR